MLKNYPISPSRFAVVPIKIFHCSIMRVYDSGVDLDAYTMAFGAMGRGSRVRGVGKHYNKNLAVSRTGENGVRILFP
jgi:hypothetical protein